MKIRWNLVVLSLVAVTVVGCTPPSASPPASSSKGDAKDTPATTADPGTKSGEAGTAETAKAPTFADIPAGLKTEAYSYLGFDHEGELHYKMVQGTNPPITGSATLSVVSISADSAVIRQSWTGGIATSMSSSEYQVKADGVFATKVGDKEIKPPSKELPASPKPGDTWEAPSKLELDSATLDSNKLKVVGIKKVTVGLGTFDALVITDQVKGTQQGKPLSMDMVGYYVKGIGAVKYVITGKGADGKPFLTSLEAVKP